MANEETKKSFRFLSEAGLIAVVPIVGYIFLYGYETGFCKKFNIPGFLIKGNLHYLFSSAEILLIAAFFIYLITETIHGLNLMKNELNRRIITNTFLVLFTLFYIWSKDLFGFPIIIFILIGD